MKLIRMILVFLILSTPLSAFAGFGQVNNSGQLSSSQLVYTGYAGLTSVLVTTDGTNNATVTVYDNTSGTGTIAAGPFVVLGPTYFGGGTWENPVPCGTGIYVTISGTNAKAILNYIKNPSYK